MRRGEAASAADAKLSDAERLAYLEDQIKARDELLLQQWGYFGEFYVRGGTDAERQAIYLRFDRILRRAGILPEVSYPVDEASDPPMPQRAA